MIGTVVANGKAHVEQNIRHATAFKPNPLLPDTQAELALPLRAGQKIIGALTVQSSQQGIFASETVAVLQSLADQLAIAIENASLFAKTENTLAETNRLYTASRRIGQATNAYEIYKTLVDFAQEAGIADGAQVIIPDPKAPDFLITPVSWGIDETAIEKPHHFPRETYSFSDHIINMEVVILAELQNQPDIDSYSMALFCQNNLHAAALLPIYIVQEWLGTLLLAHKTPNFYAASSLQPLRTLADQSATILANQRLLRQTDLLYRIGRALNQAITRDDALEIAVREIKAYTGAHQCRFVLYETGANSGELLASSNSKLGDQTYHLPIQNDYAFDWLNQKQKPLLLLPHNEELPQETIQQHVEQFGAFASWLIPAASQQDLSLIHI